MGEGYLHTAELQVSRARGRATYTTQLRPPHRRATGEQVLVKGATGEQRVGEGYLRTAKLLVSSVLGSRADLKATQYI